ncbi:MAG: PAS domain-containing protein [Alphaproteobacteria bacterium]|nr:PAS domain-containing protein [Alphaproteobacteria bacterium]
MLKLYYRIAAALVIAVGLGVVLGWQAGIIGLVRLSPGVSPMQSDTGATLALSGAALLLLGRSRVGAALLAGIVIFIAATNLLQHVLEMNWGLSAMLSHPRATIAFGFPPTMMASSTGLCFTLTGFALLLSCQERQNLLMEMAVFILGAAVAAIGAGCGVSYLLDVSPYYSWGAPRIAPHAAASFVLLGTGIVARAWSTQLRKTARYDWVLPLMAIALVAALILFWQVLVLALPGKVLGAKSEDALMKIIFVIGITLFSLLALAIYVLQRTLRGAAKVRENEAMLRALVDHTAWPVYMKDLEGRYMLANKPLCELFGCDERAVLGRTDADFVSEASALAARRNEQEVIARGAAMEFEETLAPRGGEERVYASVKFPLSDASGLVYAICGISTDITERKHYEERLKTMLEELRKANTELERFAYICSHDLQEPLRMISNYTERLAKHIGSGLDEKGQHYMHYLIEGSANARALISDVLEYARIGMRAEKSVPVDMEDVLGAVCANLELSIRESGAAVTHDPLPTVLAHKTELIQLFQNLIGNALKFRSTASLHVHVSARRDGGNWEFSVRDNGIGIAPEYREKVFQLFARLAKRGEYPGTGIGLAIAKRIVEQYGGRIWLESQPGGGTVFFFTLPVA